MPLWSWTWPAPQWPGGGCRTRGPCRSSGSSQKRRRSPAVQLVESSERRAHSCSGGRVWGQLVSQSCRLCVLVRYWLGTGITYSRLFIVPITPPSPKVYSYVGHLPHSALLSIMHNSTRFVVVFSGVDDQIICVRCWPSWLSVCLSACLLRSFSLLIYSGGAPPPPPVDKYCL